MVDIAIVEKEPANVKVAKALISWDEDCQRLVKEIGEDKVIQIINSRGNETAQLMGQLVKFLKIKWSVM